MNSQDLVKYTKLSMLEINTLATDAGTPITSPDAAVDMQVVIRAVIADVFMGCYPDKRLEILTYIRLADADGILTRGIADLVAALEAVQGGKPSAGLPVLMLAVADSRFIGLMTNIGNTYDAYDMVSGAMVKKSECKWPWMSMVLHIGTLVLRNRTFMADYKNVALGSVDQQPALVHLDHPVQADTELM